MRGKGGEDTTAVSALARYLAKKKLPVYLESRRLIQTVSAQHDPAKYPDTYDDGLKAALRNGVRRAFIAAAKNGYP